MLLTTRPMDDRGWIGKVERQRSQFTASYSDTLNLLEREVYALQKDGMPDPVLMMDITEADLRQDGMIRANSRPASDAVALAFESKKGPLIFRCDRFNMAPWSAGRDGVPREPWKHNLRAIALTLEALRKVERYGATQQDEQYAGWRQIASAPAVMSRDTALEIIARVSGHPLSIVALGGNDLASAIRVARRKAHPDAAGGSRGEWDQVEAAREVLEA